MHHAYVYAGDREAGLTAALAYAEKELGLEPVGNPDVITLTYGLFSVDEARALAGRAALAPARSDKKILIVATNRIFHEAQNALLKLFEEPPAATTLVLIVPSAGNLIATLRSRLQPLPLGKKQKNIEEGIEQEFIAGSGAVREKVIEGILNEAKSDKDEEKQEARAKALRLAEGLARAGYEAWREKPGAELRAMLTDLDRLIPVLHDRAAPLKAILEHLLLTAPKKFR